MASASSCHDAPVPSAAANSLVTASLNLTLATDCLTATLSVERSDGRPPIRTTLAITADGDRTAWTTDIEGKTPLTMQVSVPFSKIAPILLESFLRAVLVHPLNRALTTQS